jgi:hypothetical protein
MQWFTTADNFGEGFPAASERETAARPECRLLLFGGAWRLPVPAERVCERSVFACSGRGEPGGVLRRRQKPQDWDSARAK